MRIADTLSIGILNAHCGIKNFLDATPDRGSLKISFTGDAYASGAQMTVLLDL
jgi:hypothetical protein